MLTGFPCGVTKGANISETALQSTIACSGARQGMKASRGFEIQNNRCQNGESRAVGERICSDVLTPAEGIL